MIDFEFWLIVADRPVDISVYMSQMQLLYNETHNPAIRKLILQDGNVDIVREKLQEFDFIKRETINKLKGNDELENYK